MGISVFPILLIISPFFIGAGSLPSQTPPPTIVSEDQLTILARELSDTSYSVREAATRKFYEIGPASMEVLRGLVDSTDTEAAIRARRILDDIESVYFSGVEIALAFSEAHIDWDQPVNLLVTLSNRSEFPARVPVDPASLLQAISSDDAEQVATMLDLADWLIVRDEKGDVLPFHLDDIMANSAVAAVVQKKAERGGSATLQPGQSVTISLTAFNRGWARYRLLERGAYTVVLKYAPLWDDPFLVEHRVGFAESNEARIVIDQEAPPGVSREEAHAELSVARVGEELTARLANHSDMPMIINTDFGMAPPFAQGNWVYAHGTAIREIPVNGELDNGNRDLDQDLLIKVAPGKSIEVAQIPVMKLRAALEDDGANLAGARWSLHFSYANNWDSPGRAGTEETRENSSFHSDDVGENLFRWILTGRHNSNRLDAASLDTPIPTLRP